MPSMQAFFNWVRDDAATREKYQTALATRAHLFAEQVVDIAEEKMTYTVTEPDPKDPTKMVTKEVETTSPEHQARQKLRVDARKWATSKLLPKVYGEKIGIGGAEDLGPIRTITREMSPEEAYTLMMTGQAKLGTDSQDPAEGLM